tara:strand:- start:1129 stop:1338 length:210 start_codon:yes stop_codon:yes gene_type:complete
MADYLITLDQFLETLNGMVKNKIEPKEIGVYIKVNFPDRIVNTGIHCGGLFPDNERTRYIKNIAAPYKK